jgi:dTDP-4-dehydrorhamnose 3,5-epimerase
VRVVDTAPPGVVIIAPSVIQEVRGFILETFRADRFEAHGLPTVFKQDNHSRSVGGTLRGLHLQVRHVQGKLIRVIDGEVFDVAVDVRRGSPTFGQSVGIRLCADEFKLLYIPPGFAHGFCVVSDGAQVEYKCTDVYDPESEVGIAWNDPVLAIVWPVASPILSPRDQANPQLAAVMDRLPEYRTKP